MLLSKLPKLTTRLTINSITKSSIPTLQRRTMSSDKNTVRKTTLFPGVERVDYPGYSSSIAAAVVIPAGRRLVATSGMLGHNSETGKMPEALVDEFTNAFEVRLPSPPFTFFHYASKTLTPPYPTLNLGLEMLTPPQKIQKSLQAVEPSLSSDELFACIYSVNTYHVGDIQDPIINKTIVEAASKFFKGPLPAWTGVEVKGLSMGARFEVQVKAALPWRLGIHLWGIGNS